MVVSTLLERNPELHHHDCLNLDEVRVCVLRLCYLICEWDFKCCLSQLLEAAFSLLHQDINENKVTVTVQGQSEVRTPVCVELPLV